MHPCELVLEYDKLVYLPKGLEEGPDLGVLQRPGDLTDEQLHSICILGIRRGLLVSILVVERVELLLLLLQQEPVGLVDVQERLVRQ